PRPPTTLVPSTTLFRSEPANIWERQRVAGPQVIEHDGWFCLFYIGYEDMFKARICLARSRDGVTGWERHPENPILSPGLPGAWEDRKSKRLNSSHVSML